ncbi:hypothetical protein [Stratiformator vulcanicus]|uniref:Helix-turn-helix domain protein n=1 Tax=Stratiformator vulcanicus TaxID=2527980 RepID=A0A517R1G9_9PLAN|nr:hypothetical protein [Stratiformator vulcanicus]QDT37690.1 hypothetical protein Pan189_20720 [Stratiformator vulcanicus]
MRGQHQRYNGFSTPELDVGSRADEAIERLDDRLRSIEEKLIALIEQRVPQAYYSTADAAKLLGKAEFTFREWCRLGRVHAEKRQCGRGRAKEWILSNDELMRVRSEGLLPIDP